MLVQTIIVFVLIFSFLILIHELGHFAAAKKAGVKVEEFGFGLPPRIWGVKKGETLYSINWIPFGGFVRMLGEDGSGKSKSKRSFANQSIWAQTAIVCGGVFMNLLFAFLLLTWGFVIGIEPLIATQDDFYKAVHDGQIDLFHIEDGDGGVEKEVLYLPRFRYLELSDQVEFDELTPGDLILQVNGKDVFTSEHLMDAFSSGSVFDVLVYREGFGDVLYSDLPVPPALSEPVMDHAIVTYVLEASPAETAGLMSGDWILSIGGDEVNEAADVMRLNESTVTESNQVLYEVARGDEVLEFTIPLGEDGRVGVGLSEIESNYESFAYYSDQVPHQMMDIEPVQYGFEAPVVAVQEMWRLGKITAAMFVRVLGNFVSGGEVPEGVSGPVGIAQMTHVFLQDGFAAMLRFVALLSLSLGVINILPIPALDGGRMVFILYRAVTGRKPSARLEHMIHSAGFFLLILFIVYITFNDVLNLF